MANAKGKHVRAINEGVPRARALLAAFKMFYTSTHEGQRAVVLNSPVESLFIAMIVPLFGDASVEYFPTVCVADVRLTCVSVLKKICRLDNPTTVA